MATQFLVLKTYEVVTPESAEEGDFDHCGESDEWTGSAREVVEEIRRGGYVHPSLWPVAAAHMTGREWLSSEPSIEDYSTDETWTYHLHITAPDGAALKPARLLRLWRAAGIGRNSSTT